MTGEFTLIPANVLTGNPSILKSRQPDNAGQPGRQSAIPGNSEEISLLTLYKKYQDTLTAENKSLKTIEGYSASLRLFYEFTQQIGLASDLTSFNKNTVTQYVLFLKNKLKYTGHPTIAAKQVIISINTINVHLRALKAFSSWLYREGLKPLNELQKCRLLKAPRRMIQPLTREEKTQILRGFNLDNHLGYRNYAMVLLLLDSGIRATEITMIKLSDINWSRGSITVMGKGDKERTVALGNVTSAALREYIEKHRNTTRYGGTDMLFTSKGGKPITYNVLKLTFSRLKTCTKITRLHAHLCRHTFATDFIDRKGPTLALQHILGHTSLAMVQAYVHLTESQLIGIHRRCSPVDHYKSFLGDETGNNNP